MSIRVMSQVWMRSVAKGSSLLVLLAIADWADDDGWAYPRIKQLAHKARVSERETQRCLSDLRSSGELDVVLNGGPGMVNSYRVIIPARSDKPSPSSGSNGARTVTADGDQRVPASGTVTPEPSKSYAGSADPAANGDKLPPLVNGDDKPTGNTRVQSFVDACRELGITWTPNGRDAKAIKDADADPMLIARAYRSLLEGKWGSSWMRENAAVYVVIEHLGQYVQQRPDLYRDRGRTVDLTNRQRPTDEELEDIPF